MIYESLDLPPPLAPLFFLRDFIHVATGPKVQVFTANGTYTPSAGLVAAIIECVGGGGAALVAVQRPEPIPPKAGRTAVCLRVDICYGWAGRGFAKGHDRSGPRRPQRSLSALAGRGSG